LTSCASIPSARWRWTPYKQRTRVTRERQWRWRRWSITYGNACLSGVKAVNPKYEILGRLSVTLDDIKHFRQLDSKCPGHPEYRWTSGVETTTGPLGQGLATSVGMAIAQRWLASYFNQPGFDLFDYDIYALCGDGCFCRPPRSPTVARRTSRCLRSPMICSSECLSSAGPLLSARLQFMLDQFKGATSQLIPTA
jgi:Transketolase, thiamine diphosphate binding domain